MYLPRNGIMSSTALPKTPSNLKPTNTRPKLESPKKDFGSLKSF